MATSVLSLPVDVPWKRVAISPDMYATSIDAGLPEKWRSSLAVYFYEPEPDPTDVSGELTTFLKLVASITGYNYDNIVIVRRGNLPPVQLDLGTTYYPAFCALAQIAVFPDTGQWDIPQFPYFTDFQPKQREIVETKTATGEVVSHTTDPLNVTKSTTTLMNQENKILGGDNAQFLAVTGGTTNVNETTLTDASREKRETTSFQTNLSQLYQLLDTYHSGTNRAVFLTMARPHLVDSVYTFVNGPRRLEGVQEFFLVVRRPADMTGICVKAVLETAHLDPTDTSGNPATLFTTSRAVSGCMGQGGAHILPAGPWVTYEQTLSSSVSDLLSAAGQEGVQAVAAANAVGRAIRDMVVSSFRVGARYPLGTVDFLRSNFALRKIITNTPQVLQYQPDVLGLLREIGPTLTAPIPQLSEQDLAARSELLRTLGVISTPELQPPDQPPGQSS
jgi:ADP-ribose pyrophosphatase YjhB (NUDIX family)